MIFCKEINVRCFQYYGEISRHIFYYLLQYIEQIFFLFSSFPPPPPSLFTTWIWSILFGGYPMKCLPAFGFFCCCKLCLHVFDQTFYFGYIKTSVPCGLSYLTSPIWLTTKRNLVSKHFSLEEFVKVHVLFFLQCQ